MLKTLLILTFYILRAFEGNNPCCFELNQYSDVNWISDSIDIAPVSYGQLTFYRNFTSFQVRSTRRDVPACYSIQRHNHFLSVCILLCGDVHPCPGPSQASEASCDYKVFNKRGLHFIHINTRSLIPKLDEIRIIAHKTRAACICLTETWLDDSVPDAEVHIDKYLIQRRDRNRHGGGVLIYIRSDLSFNKRSDLDHVDIEATWLELLLPKSRPILCGVIYRPPNQSKFYDLLDRVCSSSVNFCEYETILLGDFNTNVSCSSVCPLLTAFRNFIDMFSFTQLIHNYTRVCSSTSTTIDLIMVSDPDKISQSGVIDTSLSDHNMIFCTRKVFKTFVGTHNNITSRSLKNYSREDFQANLLHTDWSCVLLCDNACKAWELFKNLFVSVINNVAPVKQVRIKQRTEPWIDSDILHAINLRDNAFTRYRKDKSVDNFNTFKVLRNKAQSMIKSAKKGFFTETLELHKNDSKSLWTILKNLGLPSKKGLSSTGSNICLNIDGNICFDKGSNANCFNEFYTTVASKLVEKLPACVHKFGKSFVTKYYFNLGVVSNSHSFSLVPESQVLKYLNNLTANKATGLDAIPSRFVKDGSSIIAQPLAHIINLSLIQGVVPDDLKSARVVPIFKKNDKTSVGNYRPVSILSILSKIYEKVVYDQVESYFKANKLLYKFQSGFRSGFSTDTCLIHLTDFIRMEMDKGHIIGMILLDLQKAFDTVDHSILLMKLSAAGLGDDILRWFTSYLSSRQQLVDVSGTHSASAPVTCGVPQGSILGPLLFLIYVNDMSAVVKNKLLLYADDSGILVSGKNKSDVEMSLKEDLHLVSQWLIDNKLSLHLGKTESILFGSKYRTRSTPGLDITCNGTDIKPSHCVKYLGVTLDQNLSFEAMANSVLKKANARLKYLYRKKEYLTQHTKKLLVMSLIQCHYDYACSIWYHGLSKFLKNRLQTTQNKLIRFILDLDARSHISAEHFKSLNWLPVNKRVDQIVLGHVFRIKHGLAPDYMMEHFTPQDSIHSYSTRLSGKGAFAVPKVKGFGSKSFCSIGCSLWNSLPAKISLIENVSSFKLTLRNYMLDNLA